MGKGKRPAGSSSKRPAGSSSDLNSERFKNAEDAELFELRFNNRTVIFERLVVQDGISNTRFIQCLRANRLVTLSSLRNECFEDWVREFYCNMYDVDVDKISFKTYVRGKTLSVDADKIATLLNLNRPAHRIYPFHSQGDVVFQGDGVATILCGGPSIWNSQTLKITGLTTDFRTLNTFVCYNIEPRGHKSDLLYPQAFLLYALATTTSVDIPLTILESMLRIFLDQRKLTLPFGAMICKMMIDAGCQAYSHELPVTKRQTISLRTMAMSDKHVCGRGHIQAVHAQVQTDDAEEDSIEDRLSAVECAVFDQSVQIEHLEGRVTTGFSQMEERMATGFTDIHNHLTEMFNKLRHQ